MVPADSDRISRVPPYSGGIPNSKTLPVRGFHPLRQRFPTKKALNDIAKQADKAVGMARFHIHPGDYIPLAPLPMVPAVEKPLAMLEFTAFIKTQVHAAQIPATKFKA